MVENNKELDIQLETLLSEDIASAQKREDQYLDKVLKVSDGSVVLFGAGALGRKILSCFRKSNIEPVAFSDNNPKKWGTSIDSLKVISPKEAGEKFGVNAMFVVSIWAPRHSYLKTKSQLEELGCNYIVPFQAIVWKYPHEVLPHYQFELPHKILEQSKYIRNAFGLLDEFESKRQFLAHLSWRLSLDYNVLPIPSSTDQYFPEDIISLNANEYLIDCGAYDGDTIKSFIQRQGNNFKHIIALEPDPNNFKKLNEYINTLHINIRSEIEILNFAVGHQSGKIRFSFTGGMNASATDNGQDEIDCKALDDLLKDRQPTFLKFDVEGAEKAALLGSKRIITDLKPIVAVCIYHCPYDLWNLPLLLNSFYEDYNFYIRTHDEDGLEIVCYAVPPSRTLTK